MTAVRRRSRAGFTLVELIVAISVMVLLASIALLVVPDIMSQDRTTDGAARLQQYLMIAKSRAARDHLPRGLRLINNGGFATEVQYIEAPPLYVPPNSSNPYFDLPKPPATSLGAPRIEYTCTTSGGSQTITIANLPDPTVLTAGAIVVVPGLSWWFSIQSVSGTTVTPQPQSYTGVPPYPDIGVGTSVESYQFGIYGPPQPLLGEPVQQLPSNIGVDLRTTPASSTGLSGNDIIFTPAGDLMFVSSGQVMLWVMDIRKGGGNNSTYSSFQTAGEQQIVSIKARSGALGVFPVFWPNNPTGYSAGQDAYYYAKQDANGP